MIGRIVLVASVVLAPCLLTPAHAQDVPGIEICTAEKTMERRTSCLQSNVDFLMKTIAKLSADHQQKLDAANRQIDGLKSAVVDLQKTVDDLQAAQKKRPRTRRRNGCAGGEGCGEIGSAGWVERFAKPIGRCQLNDGYRFAPPILRLTRSRARPGVGGI